MGMASPSPTWQAKYRHGQPDMAGLHWHSLLPTTQPAHPQHALSITDMASPPPTGQSITNMASLTRPAHRPHGQPSTNMASPPATWRPPCWHSQPTTDMASLSQSLLLGDSKGFRYQNRQNKRMQHTGHPRVHCRTSSSYPSWIIACRTK